MKQNILYLDLAKKLSDWETFYNFLRPHAVLNGKTPYGQLREKLVAKLSTILRSYIQHSKLSGIKT